jgi:hypothetical protein
MAEKQGRLAQLLQQEYKSKGFFSGAASAGGKRIREILDLRNTLFSGSGIGSIIGRKIFGKGYSATTDSSMASKISTSPSSFSGESVDILISIKKDTRISAKNSMVLPSMARDMNLTRQNIAKLVRLQGGSAASRADMFFKRAGERETSYESEFKNKPSLIQPKGGEDDSKSSFSDKFSKILSLAFKGALAAVGFTLTVMSGVLSDILSAIKNIYELVKKFSFPDNLKLPPVLPSSPGGGTSNAPRGGIPTPGTSTPGSSTPGTEQKGSGQPKKPTYGGGRGRPKISSRGGGAGSLTISGSLQSKLEKVLSSPKAKSKLGEILTKRFAMAGVSSLLSGPLAPILTFLSLAFTAYELNSLLDEALTESTSPTNLNEQQKQMGNLIYDRFREAGFSHEQAVAAVANAQAESSLNPNERNQSRSPSGKEEDSVGLFQMNRMGGLGVNEKTMQPYSVEQLKDPEFNIQLAIDAAKKSKAFRNASSVEEATSAFVRDVERPFDKEGAIRKRTQIALDMQGTSLGSRVNGISTEVADANRASARGEVIVNSPVSTNVQNNNNVQGGGGVASTFNDQFNELLKLSMLNS